MISLKIFNAKHGPKNNNGIEIILTGLGIVRLGISLLVRWVIDKLLMGYVMK
jgi:hypothetical protein